LDVDIGSGLSAEALTGRGIFGFELRFRFEQAAVLVLQIFDIGLAAAEKSACSQDDQIPHAASPRSAPA